MCEKKFVQKHSTLLSNRFCVCYFLFPIERVNTFFNLGISKMFLALQIYSWRWMETVASLACRW